MRTVSPAPSPGPDSTPADVAIRCRGLTRRFGDFTAVDGVDLDVRTGEVYGFLGPNGAGKSTVVRMLTTLLSPSDGTATVAGHDVATDPAAVRLRIGVALQDAALDDQQSGRELLALQARLYGLRPDEFAQRFEEVSGIVELDAIDRRIGTYSGGMKRRLDLAAALIHNPQVLFLDEPTTGLDVTSRTKVWEEVRRLNADLGMTIFLTTQYLEEADALADRVGIINGGVLAVEGTPTELKRRVGNDVIIAHLDGDPQVARDVVSGIDGVTGVEVHDQEMTISADEGARLLGRIAVALDDRHVTVRELTLRTPTLDDVFLEITGGRMAGEATA